MPSLSKIQLIQVRNDINAALKAVAVKHGIDFSLGAFRFNAVTLRATLTGVNRSAVVTYGNEPVSLGAVNLEYAGRLYLGKNFDRTKTFNSESLGNVKFVGYTPQAHKFPFIVKQISTGKQFKVSIQQATVIAKAVA